MKQKVLQSSGDGGIFRLETGLKNMYNQLPEDVKKYFDPKTYTLLDTYKNMDELELNRLLFNLKNN